MSANCPHCASAVPEGAEFCPKCGKTVATQAAAPPPAAPPPAAPPPAAPSAAQFPPTAPTQVAPAAAAPGTPNVLAPPPSGGRGGLVAALVGGGVLVVILAVVGFFLISRDGKTEPTGGPTSPPGPTAPPPGGEPPPGGGQPGGEPPPGGGQPGGEPPSGGTPQPGGRSIAESLPRQVGPFTLRGVRRLEPLIQGGAADAAQALYEESGGRRVLFVLAGYESAQTAAQHANQLIQAAQKDGFSGRRINGGVQLVKGNDEVIILAGEIERGGGVLLLARGGRGVPGAFLTAFSRTVRR